MLLLHQGRPTGKTRPHAPENGDPTPKPHLKLTNMG